MDKTVQKIVGMLEDERPDRQVAAALVLAELGVKDKSAVEALGRCLVWDDPVLQMAALEALGGVKTASVAALLVPLLDVKDPQVQARATEMLVATGKRAVGAMCKALGDSPPARKKALVNLLAPVRDAKVLDSLLALLDDNEVGDHTVWALRQELEGMTAAQIKELRTRLLALIKEGKKEEANPLGLARRVRLLGYEKSAALTKTLLPFTGAAYALPVRLAALAGLRRPLSAGRSTDAAFQALAAIAQEEGEPALARAAVDTMAGLDPGKKGRPLLSKLADSPHADVQAYALKALGQGEGAKVTRRLLDPLAGEDPAARRAATEALSTMSGAGPALVKELASCKEAGHLLTLCRVLRPHVDGLKPADRKALASGAVTKLEELAADADPLLRLVASGIPEPFAEAMFARAKVHTKAGRHGEALDLLERLDRMGRLDDDGRFAAFLAGLGSMASRKSLARASRGTDRALRHLTTLVASGKPVATRLLKAKAVSDEDLFYLGFNYAESKDEMEQELGAELLEHLVEKSPRSKLGKSARNKLRLTGLGE